MIVWVPVFSLCLLLVVSGRVHDSNQYLKREHSLIKPYYGSGLNIPFWQFKGSTIVTPNYVRLTADFQSQNGALWNTVPLKARNWDLQIHFKVHGKGTKLSGDGLAIWYAKERMGDGRAFGNTDFFHGLVIILDTYNNHDGAHTHNHPYISAMVNNGTLHYDHDRDGTHTQLDGCEAEFRNSNHDTHISVRYENDVLDVSIDFDGNSQWTRCFQVKGVRLPTGYYLGITASTGELSDNHDVISARLFELDSTEDDSDYEDRSDILPSAKYFVAPRDHIDDLQSTRMSGLKMFLLFILGLIIFAACSLLYLLMQENSKKRFY